MKTVYVDSYEKVDVKTELEKIIKMVPTFLENLVRKEARDMVLNTAGKTWDVEYNRFFQRFKALFYRANAGKVYSATKLLNLCYPKQRYMCYSGEVFRLIDSNGTMPFGTKRKFAFVRTSMLTRMRYFYGVNPIYSDVYEGLIRLMPLVDMKVDLIEYGVHA